MRRRTRVRIRDFFRPPCKRCLRDGHVLYHGDEAHPYKPTVPPVVVTVELPLRARRWL